MPKQNSNTAKNKSKRQEPKKELVTIAFKRTYFEGPFSGTSFYALTRRVTRTEAAYLFAYEPTVGRDSEGHRGIDEHIQIISGR